MKRVLEIAIGLLAGLMLGLIAAGLIYIVSRPPRGQAIPLITPTPASLAVYITGAVATPGVYSLPEGSRIEDAVVAAGGFHEDADPQGVNLAARLSDGVQVFVPYLSGKTPATPIVQRVNINTASMAELDTLPGVGPTLAQTIVDFRVQNGPFQTIEDLMNVPGIGPATFDRLKDMITVGF